MQAIDLGAILEQTFIVALKLSAPALLTALGVGLLVSLVQAVTQLNEATLSFVPKVLAIGAVMVMAGSFMTATLISFARHLFDQLILVGTT
ncbi:MULTISPECIES: flagellar biosynthetic protein FliQ [Gluconobacter]|uniref:Flagellar biosynthesis protein FliQ n=1 Tax=Gluconobacter albidus TaxID=318683 RepID=A0A149T0F7_9PROT|nr:MULTISPECIES: flagellar biosynthetic protein FliQ [Gluconobacter]AQS89894.1 flagellar biosynthesis protein FliQ [Gluconobacter albidus]KXV37775.1 flagellar biosynthesis protein FliQ [Gluconobacter albidus]KXV47126.1 flagellar biosynthesis protein FliQ [Gluconobacter albidus]MBS1027910.1 flagellar type III secretion system protein FliQ [Gluconobacter albidus]MCP1273670.1 flagellar type III secretion system protein FliQ [Gluconobacter albidus]